MKKKQKQQGQILLIIILLSTVLLTVALSISQITTEETKIAKLEEDQKKAFAAAEAGIEARMQSTTNIDNIVPLLGGGTTETTGIAAGGATLSVSYGLSFITPLITKDNQYTFYFAEYDSANNSFSNYFNAGINIYFGSQSSQNCPNVPALEMTYIAADDDDNDIKRYFVDPCLRMGAETLNTEYLNPGTIIDKVKFYWKAAQSVNSTELSISNIKIIIVRPLFKGTKLVIESANGATYLKPQGKIITSYATTTTNVSKKIKLFQSYPQIPADLFVTSF